MAEIWEVAECTGVRMVLEVLNGRMTRNVPVAAAKIILGPQPTPRQLARQKFNVFFLPDRTNGEGSKWDCQVAKNPDEVGTFLNNLGVSNDIRNLSVTGLYYRSYYFLLFFQRVQGQGHFLDLAGPWQWQSTDDPDFARGLLNGYGRQLVPMQHPRLTMVKKGSKIEFHIFYRAGDAGQIRDNWFWRYYPKAKVSELLARLNWGSELTPPVSDQIQFTATQDGDLLDGYFFHPKGFLVITRSMFLQSDEFKAYVRWKEARGFEVYTVPAGWIEQSFQGFDVRFKIRACIRKYSQSRWVGYALLIGDSNDVNPILGELTTPWNLPAGLYWFDNKPVYTTLFYGDKTDKTTYSQTEQKYQGEYTIPVGLIPARNISDLDNVLRKTMRAIPATNMTLIYSNDFYNDYTQNIVAQISSLGSEDSYSKITSQCYVFENSIDTTGKVHLYAALFERKGVIFENGHGNVDHFRIGNTSIRRQDATKFKYINPLFISLSCLVQAYYLGDSLAEAFLRCPTGPAVILAPRFPEGGPPESLQKPLLATAKNAWINIFSGKTIGQAVFDNAAGATPDEIHIFGDPSMVIFPGETIHF